jgi:DNA-binding MarR family transcriptional regulator
MKQRHEAIAMKRSRVTANGSGKGRRRVPDVAADNILALVHILSNRIGLAFHDDLQDLHGLTVPQWRILVSLANRAGITAAEIVERWALQPMTVSRAIRQLEARGLVCKRMPARDRRSQALFLTAKGRRVHLRVVPQANARYGKILDGMTARERHDLARFLTSMIAGAHDLA